MSSLAELPRLVGFFSYSRDDDEGSGGRLSKLRERIQKKIRSQLGRTRRDFSLWQDKAAIAHGTLWENEINSAIAEAVFFIPIVTPTAVRSYHCKFEFDSFLAREKELGRSDLVFPIHYITVSALEDGRWRQDHVLNIIGSRQYMDWQHLRHLDVASTEVGVAVERFCANISKALQQPWLSLEERQRETEARQLAEDERRRKETEIKRRADEEERRRKTEVEAERRAQEEDNRKKAEAKAQQRADAQSVLVTITSWLHMRGGTRIVGILLIVGLGFLATYYLSALWGRRAVTENPAITQSLESPAITQSLESSAIKQSLESPAIKQSLEAPASAVSVTQATAVKGEEYLMFRQVTLEHCSSQCAKERRCKMFAYWQNQICYLFDQNFGTYPTAASVVGRPRRN